MMLLWGHMEKQEMEMKWKLETEMETQALVVIQMLLVFVPRHPSALPSPAFALATPVVV